MYGMYLASTFPSSFLFSSSFLFFPFPLFLPQDPLFRLCPCLTPFTLP